MKKLVSELVATVIIFATIVATSLIIFFATMSNLEYSSVNAEYGYMKANLVNLANAISDILDGGTYSLSVPSRSVGIGYLNLTNKKLQLVIAGNVSIDEYPIAIYIRPGTPTVNTNSTVYGTDSYVVNNTLFIAKVDELYVNGETRVVLDTARIVVMPYKITTPNYTKYIYYLTYVRFLPTIYSSSVSRVLVVSIDSKIENVMTVNQTYLSAGKPIIVFSVNGSPVYTVNPRDVPGADSVDVVLRIITLKVVYS